MILTFLILSAIVNVILIGGIVNAIKKVEIYEDFTELMREQLGTTLTQMRDVDIRGAFEADDEVGIVFKGLAGMVERLEVFIDEQE